jgi:transcriptional regulator with XRE-family HTH domain
MSQCTIGEKIAELRKAKGLSQKDLADKLSVSNKTISKWECGNGEPDINLLKKISTIFRSTRYFS